MSGMHGSRLVIRKAWSTGCRRVRHLRNLQRKSAEPRPRETTHSLGRRTQGHYGPGSTWKAVAPAGVSASAKTTVDVRVVGMVPSVKSARGVPVVVPVLKRRTRVLAVG